MIDHESEDNLKQELPLDALRAWFLQFRRSFPWRETPTPYRVWISEVMLQQTKASVVVPYFERWLAHFPDIEALAKAPIEEVLKAWEGLGYYSRARNLHEGAKEIMENHGGELPCEYSKLKKIRGLGPYTCGAILNFAFKKKATAIDGNVLRVISRFLALEEEIDQTSVKQKIEKFVFEMLPNEESWYITEGLIELGATLCNRDPQCNQCPLSSRCLGYRHGLQKVIPKKKNRLKISALFRRVAVIRCGDHYLLQKGEKGKVMADLYEFPYVEETENHKTFEEILGISLTPIKSLPEERHTFTRFRVHLSPHLYDTDHLDPRFLWKERAVLTDLPFSSGHRRILENLRQEWTR